MFKLFEMTDFCIRSSTLRALVPSSFLTDFSRCRVTTQYVNYYVVLVNPVTIVSLLRLPHHGPILECLFLIFLSTILSIHAPIRNKLCLNEGLLKTEREPHGITKTSRGRMRALDTAERNAITT